MAKGVPILGKDPLGKAKYANVTESGDLRVQLSGTTTKFVTVPGDFEVTAGATRNIDISVREGVEAVVLLGYTADNPSTGVGYELSYMWRWFTYASPTFMQELPIENIGYRGFTSEKMERHGASMRLAIKNTRDVDITFKLGAVQFGLRDDGIVVA